MVADSCSKEGNSGAERLGGGTDSSRVRDRRRKREGRMVSSEVQNSAYTEDDHSLLVYFGGTF